MKCEYEKAPSYKLVILLKQCKVLLTKHKQDLKETGYTDKVQNTANLIKTILINRQVVN